MIEEVVLRSPVSLARGAPGYSILAIVLRDIDIVYAYPAPYMTDVYVGKNVDVSMVSAAYILSFEERSCELIDFGGYSRYIIQHCLEYTLLPVGVRKVAEGSDVLRVLPRRFADRLLRETGELALYEIVYPDYLVTHSVMVRSIVIDADRIRRDGLSVEEVRSVVEAQVAGRMWRIHYIDDLIEYRVLI